MVIAKKMELTTQSFHHDEIDLFKPLGLFDDADWPNIIKIYIKLANSSKHFYLIDDRSGLGVINYQNQKDIVSLYKKSGVDSVRVAIISTNPSHETLAKLFNKICQLESFNGIAEVFPDFSFATAWLLKEKSSF